MTTVIKIRCRTVAVRNRRPGERSHIDEWQVVMGRKILSRHDAKDQAEDWITKNATLKKGQGK